MMIYPPQKKKKNMDMLPTVVYSNGIWFEYRWKPWSKIQQVMVCVILIVLKVCVGLLNVESQFKHQANKTKYEKEYFLNNFSDFWQKLVSKKIIKNFFKIYFS